MSKDLILLDGLGIAHNERIPSGTIAIILRDGGVSVVPAEKLRDTIKEIGSDKVEGLTLSPSDFEKLQVVIDRRAADGPTKDNADRSDS
ncbi:hypothetical protein GCM10007874_21800 [Labrys miyagiensis]|uniref:Uncharacterized protein n=1 Tax=Labrys miyagiensis TaxID=346912 RepID=A0ABQ6CHH5_9HYPH|nr:hypothetical protein [Labrys miyagiensis]GLS19163.1 hypothetical protein GCM10007874_21800 [Labrys miyagiensis]